MIMKVPQNEKLVLAGDPNRHVGESRIVFERWHGRLRVGERNEGERTFCISPKLLTLH